MQLKTTSHGLFVETATLKADDPNEARDMLDFYTGEYDKKIKSKLVEDNNILRETNKDLRGKLLVVRDEVSASRRNLDRIDREKELLSDMLYDVHSFLKRDSKAEGLFLQGVIVHLMLENKKIKAVKLIRDMIGKDLKEAKEYVESVWEEHQAKENEDMNSVKESYYHGRIR